MRSATEPVLNAKIHDFMDRKSHQYPDLHLLDEQHDPEQFKLALAVR